MAMSKNPLSVVLGSYIQHERNKHGLSSLKMAENLDMGESIYRMVEAGSSNLNPNRSVLLIHYLNDSKIKIDRLSLYLSSIHSYELTKEKRKGESLSEFIGQLDEKLEYFVSKINSFLKLKSTSENFKEALERAREELKLFLGEENYLPVKSEHFENEITNKMLEIPSINMVPIAIFFENQTGHVPLHVGPVASEWEEKTMGFVKLRGIYRNSATIVNDNNLSQFLYPYLGYEKFTAMEMIFLEDINPDELKDEFVKKLNQKRKKANREILSDDEKRKIHFKTSSDLEDRQKANIDNILKGRDDIFPKLNAFWNFTHRYGVEIGFVGGEDSQKNYAINLSYKESLNRVAIFDSFWNNL